MDYKDIVSVRKEINTNPTEKQKEAGNYKKGHIHFGGFEITIENPKGSYRSGKDRNGREWKTLMHNDYGYFTRTVGKDGDAVDVFLGPDLNSKKIFPIDQYNGENFDETKVMLGFNSKEEAKEAYLSNYSKDWKGFKYITEVDIDTFKGWLYNGRRQRKPFALYKSLNEDKVMINESADWGPVQDALEDYSCSDILWEFLYDKRAGRAHKHWDVIPAEQYHNLLRRYMENPSMARTPNIVKEWMDEIIIKNTLSIEYITDLAGHSSSFPFDDCENVFDEEDTKDFGYDYYKWSEYLDNLGFYEWCSLPDGSDGWTDYGLKPIYKILNEYNYDTSPEDTLILINRVLDVYHCRGDLASAFIQGGSHSCDYISNSINESIDIKKALKNLKKRKDPANIENWNNMINEDFSSGILAKLAKEHGGIQISRNGGLRQFPCAFLRGHGVNPSDITDDMIIGEPFEYSPYDRKSDNAVLFNDGTAIELDRNVELPQRTAGARRLKRFGSGIGDTGDHDKTRGGFIGKGKDAESAPYNGWQSSERAGYSQSLRDAYKINKEMGDTKTAAEIKARARSLVAESNGRKIYLSESQFKALCRQLLREKRNEDYAKKLLREIDIKK